MDSRGKIWPALDCSWDRALIIARALQHHPAVGGFKLNRLIAEALFDRRRDYLRELFMLGAPLFLDAKHIDIPETVAGWISNYAASGMVSYVTVMARGEVPMMQAAVRAGNGHPQIIAVTELTSLGPEEIKKHTGRTPEQSVEMLAGMAVEAGLSHIVCSGNEVEALRDTQAHDFGSLRLIVPATTPAWAEAGGDQKRVTRMADVCRAGGSMIAGLVFGRIFVNADDPRATADRIAEEIESIREGE